MVTFQSCLTSTALTVIKVSFIAQILCCPFGWLDFVLLSVCFKVHIISREEEDSSSICTECCCLPCPLYSVGATNLGRTCQVSHAGWHFLLFWTEKLRRSGSMLSLKQPTTLLKKQILRENVNNSLHYWKSKTTLEHKERVESLILSKIKNYYNDMD